MKNHTEGGQIMIYRLRVYFTDENKIELGDFKSQDEAFKEIEHVKNEGYSKQGTNSKTYYPSWSVQKFTVNEIHG